MKMKDRLKNTLIDSKKSFKNYPVSIISLVLLFIIFVVNIEMNEPQVLINIMQLLTLFIPISLIIRVISKDKFENDKVKEFLMYGISILFLFVYYNLLLKSGNQVENMRVIGFNFIFYLVFFYINKVKDDKFTDYVIGRIGKIILSGIYSLVLYLGIVFILFTLNNLFTLELSYKFYLYSFAFIGLVFFPVLVLSRFTEEYDEDYNYPRAFKGLLLYIVIPLSLIYIFILYAYFIKILLTRAMPEGLISHLVLWYSIIVVGILFFIKPIIGEREYLKKYSRILPIAMIPILLMMFVSMGIRIKAYGLTENRYFVVAMGVWIFVTNLYIIFKKDYKTRFIPVLLSLAILISIIGPLSAFNLSFKSQAKRLDGILRSNNMLEDGRLKKATNISNDKKVEISSILNYITRNHSVKDIDYLDNNFTIEDMERDFGFEYMRDYYGGNYINLSLDRNSIIKVEDYDYLIDIEDGSSDYKKIDDLQIKYDHDMDNLEILKDGKRIYERDIRELSQAIYGKNKSDSEFLSDLDVESLQYIDENEDINIKIVFEEILLLNEEGNNSLDVVKFKLFFGLK